MRARRYMSLGRTAAARRATPAVARRSICAVLLQRSGCNRATRCGDKCTSLHLLGVRGAAAAAAAASGVHELRGLRRWLGGLQRCSAIRATPSAATGAVMQACAAAGCHALHARACDTCSPHVAGLDRLAQLAADGLHGGQSVWCEAWQPLELHRVPTVA